MAVIEKLTVEQLKEKLLKSGQSEGIVIGELLDCLKDAPEEEHLDITLSILKELREWAQTGIEDLTGSPRCSEVLGVDLDAIEAVMSTADVEFTAHARGNMPKLVRLCRRLHAELLTVAGLKPAREKSPT